MPDGTLTIFNASAGSGKTYTLTGIYLSSLFRSRYNYRKILSVTFTNKATAEMKERILDNLHKLASGKDSEYLEQLIRQTGKPATWIRAEAGEILNSILHDFSRFSVSTIDSFFQKILRAFAREAGLRSGYNIELDHTALLSTAIDEMISSASDDARLREWLIKYATSNIDEEKSWDLRREIARLSQELFREKFKILSAEERMKLKDKDFLLKYIDNLKCICSSFEKGMAEKGRRALAVYHDHHLTDDMFYRKGQGVPNFIRKLSRGEIPEPNSYVRAVLDDPPRWSTGNPCPELTAAINGGLGNAVTEAIASYDAGFTDHCTARVILRNIYALGILSDVLTNIHKQTASGNIFLLSDAGEFLSLITEAEQCPFIYEKVGNAFENFMIDEFQDTSIIQWKNFNPLVSNSMSQGFDNLIVGDIKQSIYRWRNSDWRILGTILASQVDGKRFKAESLATNYRSSRNVIRFNNALFSVLPGLLDQRLENSDSADSFKNLYSESVQVDPGKKEGGYVRLEFIQDEEDKYWKDTVLERLPSLIESLQDKGYNASDIGIIVRDGSEGAMVLNALINYSNSASEDLKSKYNYNVVSNDSLLLSKAHVISFIISVLSVCDNSQDVISDAAMLRYYLLSKGEEDPSAISFTEADKQAFLPAGYREFIGTLKGVPLFEAVESVISFFMLGENESNAAYLNTFQDHVLGFSANGNPDVRSFLDWWETSGCNKSVVLPGNQDAIRILTIHKSKGLEFRIVLLPFIAWNLEHSSTHQPLLWVRPSAEPFNELGIVPVRCSRELEDTIFAGYYKEERYSAHLDNLNLLYVAMTRAREALFCFSVNNPGSKNTIAGVLKEAFICENINNTGCDLNAGFDKEKNLFEMGELNTVKQVGLAQENGIFHSGYTVNRAMGSLRLKLHGENYFSPGETALRERINYGKLMHEVFEGINTQADIPIAVQKLVFEGKLPASEVLSLQEKILKLISNPAVSSWFSPENKVFREAGILLTSGNIRRPDRVIVRNGLTTVIDFKFGKENEHYAEQVDLYRSLLSGMGYDKIDAYIWYVDQDKVVKV
jgi:ATP-dependent exoDNAse (exonuclease V) beta subunit